MRQICRNVVTLMPLRQVPMATPEAEPQGNAMSVRITAAGAVAIVSLTFLTAPVSACDERYIKKCERASAAVAGAAEEQGTPVAKRKSAGRVHVLTSRRVRHIQFAKRARAPEFARRGRVAPQPQMELASAESKPVTLPDPPPAKLAVAVANAAPAPQAFVSAASPQPPDQPQPSGFPVHQLVIALCGALGAASALRFIVGA